MKVLIIRFSSIGDIVLTTPVIRCLKQQVPGVEVHYLTKKRFSALLAPNPYIDKIWELEGSLQPILKELEKEKFDIIIDLHHNLRSRMVKWRLGTKSYSFDKLNWKKWLLVKLHWNILPKKHIVQRYLDTLAPIGVRDDGQGLDHFIPQKEEVNISSLPAALHQGYIAFAIGAQHATKRLPTDKIVKICKELHLPVLLLGGKEDSQTANELVAILGEKAFSACGKYSLHQSASLVRQAKKMISHDTGLMHIASAFNKEIISIWGNTVPEFGMYPYKIDKGMIAQVSGLSCRPCSKIGFQNCPKRHFKCMNDLDFNTIIQTINE